MNQSLWRVTLMGLLGGALLACARTPAAAEPPRAALETAIHRWVAAVNARDEATLASMMTEDVELTGGTTKIAGRDAVIRALRATADRGKLVATSRDISISGDEATHSAALSFARAGVMQVSGEAHENWKLVNGEWKLWRRTVALADDPDVSLTRPSTKEPVLDQPPN